MTTISITIPKKEKNRLAALASRFGLSLAELSRQVLTQLSQSVSLESLRDYSRPITLKNSIRRAEKEWKSGKLSQTL